jgi:hypothetical protein
MNANPDTNYSLNDFFHLMKKNEVIMIYEGEFSQDITKSFLSMTESTFINSQVNESVIKKVYNIMMEALQNICKHEFKFSESIAQKTTSIFMIAENDREYQIVTGNTINSKVISIIRDKIEEVNSLDQEGLKALYKETRLNSTISEVGGAGLGFIDIARKSGNPISYHFEKLTEELHFFTQMATVNKQI